jgi:aldehyde:ferredoxin oxidoreductase
MAARKSQGQTLLRINLTRRIARNEAIPYKDTEALLGGRALAAALLFREVPAHIDPLGPENKLILSTGPLTGTGAFGSHHYCITTKSPLTGLYLDTLSSGFFAHELKNTGNDFVIIEGVSEKPVYIVITENGVTFHDAGALLGLSTGETQSRINEAFPGKKMSIATIGPAGERLIPYAGVVNEERIAARGGAGAVMGSKNLKAIAVSGPIKHVNLAEPSVFKEAMRQARTAIARNPMLSKIFPAYGTMGGITHRNKTGGLVIRNFQEGSDERFEAISGQAMEKRGLIVKSKFCAPPCPAKCVKVLSFQNGKEGPRFSRGSEYETQYALGTCCGIADPEVLIQAESICNQMGLDTISTGVSIAFAMECYEKGIIGKEDTGGLELRFGEGDLIGSLIQDIAYRRGFGRTLALGTKKMSEQFGKGSDQFAMNAKGMELGGYDPRVTKGMALVYACGPRGGCHHAGGFTAFDDIQNQEIDFRTEAAVVKASRNRRVFCDSAIICTFLTTAINDETVAGLIRGATGLEVDADELFAIGDRGSNVERAFNVREGLRRNWDILPGRLVQETLPVGEGRGKPVMLDPLLDEFYSFCGWDRKTGIPTKGKLESLGLEEISGELERLE